MAQPQLVPLSAPCPECSPDEPVPVQAVRRRRMRCLRCGAYFEAAAEPRPVDVNVVVSRGRASSRGKVRFPADEALAVGEERVLDLGEQAAGVQVTALELPGGRRVERARAADVVCIWARAVDEVELRVVVQKGWRSQPHVVKVHGLYGLSVGGEEALGGVRFRVRALRLRAGRTLRRKGEAAQAKDVQTVYAGPAVGGRRDEGGGGGRGGAGRAHGGPAPGWGERRWSAGRRRGSG